MKAYYLHILFNERTKRFRVVELLLPLPKEIGSIIILDRTSYKYVGCIECPTDIHNSLTGGKDLK